MEENQHTFLIWSAMRLRMDIRTASFTDGIRFPSLHSNLASPRISEASLPPRGNDCVFCESDQIWFQGQSGGCSRINTLLFSGKKTSTNMIHNQKWWALRTPTHALNRTSEAATHRVEFNLARHGRPKTYFLQARLKRVCGIGDSEACRFIKYSSPRCGLEHSTFVNYQISIRGPWLSASGEFTKVLASHLCANPPYQSSAYCLLSRLFRTRGQCVTPLIADPHDFHNWNPQQTLQLFIECPSETAAFDNLSDSGFLTALKSIDVIKGGASSGEGELPSIALSHFKPFSSSCRDHPGVTSPPPRPTPTTGGKSAGSPTPGNSEPANHDNSEIRGTLLRMEV